MKTIAFFNNRGGVGKTTLAYHAAWMAAGMGRKVLTVDLDPQANLTSMFLSDEQLETVWVESGENKSIMACVKPIMEGIGDISEAPLFKICDTISLIPGDLALSRFEDHLSDSWPRCLDQDPRAFRVTTAFYRVIQDAATALKADLCIIDIGPNLGAINRSSLIASDSIAMPLVPGLFSLQGLRNLGPTLIDWRESWSKRLNAKPKDLAIRLPLGTMKPAGYIVMQHAERRNRPVQSFQRWVSKIPSEYYCNVLHEKNIPSSTDNDPYCMGYIKNYLSLMSYAQDARKPVFHLTAADGAIGAHAEAVSKSYLDFKRLTLKMLERAGVAIEEEG